VIDGPRTATDSTIGVIYVKIKSPQGASHIIFCDGACSGNPGPGGWAAIVITSDQNIIELGGSDRATTNNKMELNAAIEGLEAAPPGPVTIYTDSTYVIRGITQWIWGWIKNGWRSSDGGEVSNKEYWQRLSSVVTARKKEGTISWKYVRGHTGVAGNERCDEIAVAFSQGKSIELYDGPLAHYGISIMNLPKDEPLPETKFGASEKKQPVSYLSLIGSIPMRHSNWGDCERRVKGQSGAKFKKAMSLDEEKEILRSWGLDPSKVKFT
jgi:ribonuclease HI